MISAPVSLSRLPVGSSARTIRGLHISARARATRCCSPPDSSFGRWSRRSARPTFASSSFARARGDLIFTAPVIAGSTTFSTMSSSGIKWKLWNTNPIFAARMRLRRRAAPKPLNSESPSSSTSPDVGRSSPPRMLRSVVFPAPLRPITATCSPGSTESDTSSSTGIRFCPGRR